MAIRLRALKPNCIIVPVPNGAFFPARTVAERTLVRRLVHQMKAEGQMMPGAADLLVLWRDGCGAIELKRPAQKTLLGKTPAGRASDAQIEFADRCAVLGIRHVYATSWEDVRKALADWGRI